MKHQVKTGSASRREYVFIQDSSVTTGAGLTGLAYNSGSLVASYVREGAARQAISLATQTVTGAFSSGGFVEVDATNMPGVYRLDVPDAVFAGGATKAVVMLKGATNMAPVALEYQLVAFDPDDAVRQGLTALPNAAANTAGGLASMVRLAGTLPAQTGASAAAGTVNLASGGISADNEGVGELLVVFSAAFTVRGAGVITASVNSTDRVTLNNGSALDFTPTSGDTYARIVLPGLAGMDAAGIRAALGLTSGNLDTQLSGIQSDTNDIQSRLPAALVSGRIDASVGAMASGVVTAAAVASGAIDADALATDAVTEITGGVLNAMASSYNTAGSIGEKINSFGGSGGLDAAGVRAAVGLTSANLDTQLSGIQSDTNDLQTRVPATLDGGNMRASVQSMAANTVNASALAADAVAEIQSGLATGAALSTVATYLDTEVAAILAAVDTEIAAIKAKTDLLPAAPAGTGDIPTASANATALLDLADALETGITVRKALRALVAAAAGKTSNGGLTFRNLTDTKNVIVGTVDSDGNRTSATLDLT